MNKIKQRLISAQLKRELSIKNGVVTVDTVACDGCESCIDVCPHAAIEIITLSKDKIKALPFKGRLKVKIKGNKKAYIKPDKCTSCGRCMKQCHELAIHKTERVPQ